jgi:hypothetical protein
MIKIKIYELNKHRNETTFRPYLFAEREFNEIGIQFVKNESYDFAWVGQASIIDKKLSLSESVELGIKFLEKNVGDNFFLFDGQDASSLIGTYEILKNSKALLLFKNSLLKDRNLYKEKWVNGRYYWGAGNYSCDDIDDYIDKIKLSGTNWLSTVKYDNWFDYNTNKPFDVSALFGFPFPKINYEHGLIQSNEYDKHRKKCIDAVNTLKVNVAKLENGIKLSQNEYYNTMYNSKIILAPFGYGEIAPRDIESAIFGSVLLKPCMNHVDTYPNIYIDGETYISCKHDYSDLEEKVDYILSNYKQLQPYLVENMRKKYKELYSNTNLVMHMYNVFSGHKKFTTQ